MGILNCATPCDLDADAILEAAKTGLVITYEDHNVKTGISGEVARILCGTSCNLKTLGVHKYGSSTSPDNLYQEQGIDVESLKNIVKLNLK